MSNQELCIQYLNNGIEYKRNGNYKAALEQYEKAYHKYPYNKYIYLNNAKVYICIGQHERVLVQLLTYAHLILETEQINMQNFEFSLDMYNWSGNIEETYIDNDFILKAVSSNLNLAKIVSDVNLTFLIGFAYIMLRKQIVRDYQINHDLINNQLDLYMGNTVKGRTINDSSLQYGDMIRVIGLYFIIKNLITNKLEISEVVEAYFSERYYMDLI
ncbi:tetratricopeptide repeat protein [Empedobacter falsenii]